MSESENLAVTKQDDAKIDEEWLKSLHSQVGREVSTARQSQIATHNWVIGIMTAALAAIWALGDGDFDYPTEMSFIAVLAILPLVFRFFVRSCLEYQIFNRWLGIRNAIDAYFYVGEIDPKSKYKARESLKEQIRLYYFRWKQPKSTAKMIWDNFQLAYGWAFILIAVMLIWGVAELEATVPISIAAVLVVAWMLFEVINFTRYFSGRHEIPESYFDPRKI